MPTIVVAASKGGAGKTTTCRVLISEFVRNKIDFTVIDADPNQHLSNWALDAGVKNVVKSSQDSIVEDIKTAERITPFVIVDVEGSRNMTMSYAINLSNFVIVATKAAGDDTTEGNKLVDFIRAQEEVSEKTIDFAVLRTEVDAAIHTMMERALIQNFTEMQCEIFKNRLVKREAYRTIVPYKCFVQDLPTQGDSQQKSKDKAITNGEAIFTELLSRVLKENADTTMTKEYEHA